jgi:hypothetical protein
VLHCEQESNSRLTIIASAIGAAGPDSSDFGTKSPVVKPIA